jgi:hypothetical protein
MTGDIIDLVKYRSPTPWSEDDEALGPLTAEAAQFLVMAQRLSPQERVIALKVLKHLRAIISGSLT